MSYKDRQDPQGIDWDLWLFSSNMTIDMWTEDFYKLLSTVGDDYEVQFMRLCPTLHKVAVMYNNPQTIIEDNIDFWYDSLNDCYANRMPIEMICTYVEAITDDDTE